VHDLSFDHTVERSLNHKAFGCHYCLLLPTHHLMFHCTSGSPTISKLNLSWKKFIPSQLLCPVE